jgi:hypothetical protein
MAHGIETVGGTQDRIVIEGSSGWHQLGENWPIIGLTEARDAFMPMDWSMEDAFLANGNKIEGFKAVSSGGYGVGMVGNTYTMVSMDDLFALAESVCLAHGTGRIVSVGTLHGREDFFIDLEIGQEFRHKDDVSKAFIGLTNNAVGNRPVIGGAHSERMVCANTLNLALRDMKGSPRTIKIRHSKSAHNRLQEANRILGLSMAAFDAADTEMHAMIALELSDSGVNWYYNKIMPIQSIPAKAGDMSDDAYDKAVDSIERANRKAERIRADWIDTLDTEMKILRADSPNLWLAMNSVTKWAQHTRTVRGESNDSMLRLWSNRYGDGYDRTNEAHDIAVEMLTAC